MPARLQGKPRGRRPREPVVIAHPTVQPIQRLLLTVKEAAVILGISERKMWDLVRLGIQVKAARQAGTVSSGVELGVLSFTEGRRRLVPLREIEAYIERKLAAA